MRWCGFDPIDEVARHARGEIGRRITIVTALSAIGEKQGRLSGGVAAPGDHRG